MSTITKVAVYDGRLMQEAPAYAVQKGALSVSVAPFNAISAGASQMVFQILVPSLNVFVDRKIQLRTSLNFTANLFYSGARSVTSKAFQVAASAGLLFTSSGYTISTSIVLPSPAVTVGTVLQFSGTAGSAANFRVTVVSFGTPGATTQTIFVDQQLPSITAAVAGLVIEVPCNWDAPDPVMGVRTDLATEAFAQGVLNSNAFTPLGYATAVSSKDLAYCQFPVQSALSNMTATLNDCTVTTNGDTLREQLWLTSTRENIKQRTTPTNNDTFSWGRDDALNGSGNFSSYSVVDSFGDIPNGAYPTTWYSSTTYASTTALSNIETVLAPTPVAAATPDATGSYPFLPIGTVRSFNMAVNASSTTNAGTGWYIAAPTGTSVLGAARTAVVVPFVDGQPVWTTAFPGGDLYSQGNIANKTTGSTMASGGFTLSANVLTLLKTVPPYCMIGARLYKTDSVTGPGVQPTVVGWVCNILTGALGAPGSTYNFVTAEAAGLAAIATNLSLGAGHPVLANSLPVFGQVTVVEPLVLSPFIWADSAEFTSVGLYGMTNMQVVMNFGTLGTAAACLNSATLNTQQFAADPYWYDDLSRTSSNTGNILRSSSIRTTISDLAFAPASGALTGPWVNPSLYVGFLTPGPDITLPLVSTVPYVEFPRYTINKTVALKTTPLVATNTISLTSIPDMVMLYVKPGSKGPGQLDQYIPISKVSISFDNFSNLCSGFQQFNLYESAVAAGLDMDWHQWRGYTAGSVNSVARVTGQATLGGATVAVAPVTQLSGGPILLRMGHDITLSPGLAPGCLGNYSFQAELTVDNPYGFYNYITDVNITLIAINTGFFETVRGQSAIRKTVLNSADVEAAIPEAGMSRSTLTRMVGRGAYLPGGSAGPMSNAMHMAGQYTKQYRGSGPGGDRMGGDEMGSKRPRSGIC